MLSDRNPLVEEAARIVCSEALTDYRTAKLKAMQRLGLSPHAVAQPDNAQIDAAVVRYQELFGGSRYQQRLLDLRRLAVQLLRRLAAFEPRLTGAAVSGAVTSAHRLQLHVFAEQSEAVDLFLFELGLPFELAERRYRYPGGREETLPLLRLEIDGLGVDIAVFALDDLRRAPISPQDGRVYRRLDLAAAEALLAATA